MATCTALFQYSSIRILTSPVTRCPRIAVYQKQLFGTMVVAGSTPDHIKILIPETVGPTVYAESPVDLQHVVGLSLGPAANLSLTLPPADLALALCGNSVLPTLTLSQRDYWDEINRKPDPEKMAVYGWTSPPGFMDGPCARTALRTGITQRLCPYYQPCLRKSPEVLPRRRPGNHLIIQ